MRELVETLSPREMRMFRWSAAAVAAALWFSLAWANPWVLLAVPLFAGGFVAFVYRNRQLGLEDERDDDDDLL
jgi:fatty acid desaturase